MQICKALCLIAILCTLPSCEDKIESPLILPSKENITGFWKLDKIFIDGGETQISAYEPTMLSLYYHFDINGTVEEIQDHVSSASALHHTWSLRKDRVFFEAFEEFKIESFSENEIVTIPKSLAKLKYKIVFIRIAEDEYPAILFSGHFNSHQNGTTDVVADYDIETDKLEIYANQISNYFYFRIKEPQKLLAGQSYDIDGVNIYVSVSPTLPPFDDFRIAKSGQVTVVKIDDDYIKFTFEFVAANTTGEEFVATNGMCKAIIKTF